MTRSIEIPGPAEGVQVGGMDIAAEYMQLLASLNDWTPTPGAAQRRLERSGFGADAYDRIISEGESFDENHTLRALIAVVRGDERPLGDIYHDMRMGAGGEISALDVEKTRGMARRSDPNREKSPYFS